MGGQACVLYGAAEFSRDIDLCLPRGEEGLGALRVALDRLGAEVVEVPPFEVRWLEEGLAVHLRLRAPEVEGVRVDLMTRMRRVAPFDELWARRTTFELEDEVLEAMSLPDLAVAKKTQRDKDWPMLRRLVEASWFADRDEPTPPRIDFWLRELRTPELLIEAAARHPEQARRLAGSRPLLEVATRGPGCVAELERRMREEEDAEREADRQYWRPLRKRLEDLRREARRRGHR